MNMPNDSDVSENEPKNASDDRLTTILQRLQFITPYDWRESVYTQEIDALLAELALDEGKPTVAEAAARAIGRIRSEAAVKVLAEHQRSGKGGALRALALVRDEAPSLPKSVSQQARFYTWLNNTWRRLTDNPLRAVWRYLSAAVFAGIAVWWYAYSQISSAAIFWAARWGQSLTSGIPIGVVFGLVVLFGAEVPERLRGFWPWWARLILSLLLGFVGGAFFWLFFEWFLLYLEIDSYNSINIGALCMAVTFTLGAVFRIPGWLGAIWAGAWFYAALFVTDALWTPEAEIFPLLFVRPGQTLEQFAIPIAILIGIGAYFPQLIGDLRRLLRRLRRPIAPPAPTAPTASVST